MARAVASGLFLLATFHWLAGCSSNTGAIPSSSGSGGSASAQNAGPVAGAGTNANPGGSATSGMGGAGAAGAKASAGAGGSGTPNAGTGGMPSSGAAGASRGGAGTSAGAAGATGVGGASAGAGGAASGSGGSSAGMGGTAGAGGTGSPSYDQVKQWIDDYKAAHPGNGGKDWDINAKTTAEIAADPAAQQLLSLCGKDQRPVIPSLAWEYGGNDHQWINPDASALVYCVYIPVNPSSSNWQYDMSADHVTADVYVLFPDQNPCKDKQGADQVAACIGDPTNFEILVDTTSLNDGADAGLSLSNASTELKLILPDGSKVHLHDDA